MSSVSESLDKSKTLTVEDSKNISWNEYFMGFAIMAAFRSKDPACQVGAVIVNSDNRLIATGYNGFPDCHRTDAIDSKNEEFERFDWSKDEKHRIVCHAELNAITNATQDIRSSTMYVTRFPCIECAKLIVQSRIIKVYYLDCLKAKHKQWGTKPNYTEFDASNDLFKYAAHNLTSSGTKPEGYQFAERLPGFKVDEKTINPYLAPLYERLRGCEKIGTKASSSKRKRNE